MKIKKLIFASILSLLSVAAIAQSIIMKDTRYLKAPMSKIALITQIPDDQLRLDVEESILAAMDKNKIEAMNAYEFLTYDSAFNYSTLEREFINHGIDGILIVKLINVEITDMYIFPGDVLPPDAYNCFEYYKVYYYYDLPIIAEPGYLAREDKTFRIDMNLYQNKGDMIIMSAQTKLFDPKDPAWITKSIGKKLAKLIRSNKLVVRN